MEEKGIKFIAQHYRPGKFNSRRGWRRLGISRGGSLRAWRIAAAAAALVAISATATFIYNRTTDAPQDSPAQLTPMEQPMLVVRAIDFDDTPLPVVVTRIREVYGVEVAGVPADAAGYRLTLHYEGNVADLVESINEILGIQMTVEQ